MTMTTTMTTTDQPVARRALEDHRRSARHHLDLPCDDGGELAHHLMARYLGAFADLAADGDLGADRGAVPLAPRTLLTSLGEVFAAVAERRQLAADDPALRALAGLLLDAGETAGQDVTTAGLSAAA